MLAQIPIPKVVLSAIFPPLCIKSHNHHFITEWWTCPSAPSSSAHSLNSQPTLPIQADSFGHLLTLPTSSTKVYLFPFQPLATVYTSPSPLFPPISLVLIYSSMSICPKWFSCIPLLPRGRRPLSACWAWEDQWVFSKTCFMFCWGSLVKIKEGCWGDDFAQ